MPASKNPAYYQDVAAAFDLALAATAPIVYELESPGMVTNFIQRSYSFRKAIEGTVGAIRYADMHVKRDPNNERNVILAVRKLTGTFKDADGNVLKPKPAVSSDPLEEEAKRLFEDLGDVDGLA